MATITSTQLLNLLTHPTITPAEEFHMDLWETLLNNTYPAEVREEWVKRGGDERELLIMLDLIIKEYDEIWITDYHCDILQVINIHNYNGELLNLPDGVKMQAQPYKNYYLK